MVIRIFKLQVDRTLNKNRIVSYFRTRFYSMTYNPPPFTFQRYKNYDKDSFSNENPLLTSVKVRCTSSIFVKTIQL